MLSVSVNFDVTLHWNETDVNSSESQQVDGK